MKYPAPSPVPDEEPVAPGHDRPVEGDFLDPSQHRLPHEEASPGIAGPRAQQLNHRQPVPFPERPDGDLAVVDHPVLQRRAQSRRDPLVDACRVGLEALAGRVPPGEGPAEEIPRGRIQERVLREPGLLRGGLGGGTSARSQDDERHRDGPGAPWQNHATDRPAQVRESQQQANIVPMWEGNGRGASSPCARTVPRVCCAPRGPVSTDRYRSP